VGYCMGGRTSFLANSAVPLKAAISYYGGNMPSLLHRTNKLGAPMLLFWGELDQHIPAEQRNQVTSAMREAKKQYVDIVVSDADHGFFCDARKSYDPTFTIPAEPSEPIAGKATIRFSTKDVTRPLVLDFSPDADHITSITVGGRPSHFRLVKDHIIIPSSELASEENAVEIIFRAG